MNEKHNIGSLFDRIAGKYDFLNHLLSLNIDKLWRKKAVNTIVVKHKDYDYQCLDVAIGTADLAIELARQLKEKHATFTITGIDLSTDKKVGTSTKHLLYASKCTRHPIWFRYL